jgi:hypothetical protein
MASGRRGERGGARRAGRAGWPHGPAAAAAARRADVARMQPGARAGAPPPPFHTNFHRATARPPPPPLVDLWLGRIVALCHRSSILYQNHEHIRYLFSEATPPPPHRWRPSTATVRAHLRVPHAACDLYAGLLACCACAGRSTAIDLRRRAARAGDAATLCGTCLLSELWAFDTATGYAAAHWPAPPPAESDATRAQPFVLLLLPAGPPLSDARPCGTSCAYA